MPEKRELIKAESCWLFNCDIQKIFFNRIFNMESVMYSAMTMNTIAQVFDIPMVVTVQAANKLGGLVPELAKKLPKGTPIVRKTQFSMMTPDVMKI